jgi:hypothetical protein
MGTLPKPQGKGFPEMVASANKGYRDQRSDGVAKCRFRGSLIDWSKRPPTRPGTTGKTPGEQAWARDAIAGLNT